MHLTVEEKTSIERDLVSCLSRQPEVRKLVIFGSFLGSSEPHDLDIAVFQDSQEAYLPLAMRYRRLTRVLAQRIPLDIIPIRASEAGGAFLAEIDRGQVIY